MKTENLTKASHSLDFFFQELRMAHTDAVTSGGQFEPVLFDLMEEALRLQVKLETLPIRLRAKNGQTHYRLMAGSGSIHNGLWHQSDLARNRIGTLETIKAAATRANAAKEKEPK